MDSCFALTVGIKKCYLVDLAKKQVFNARTPITRCPIMMALVSLLGRAIPTRSSTEWQEETKTIIIKINQKRSRSKTKIIMFIMNQASREMILQSNINYSKILCKCSKISISNNIMTSSINKTCKSCRSLNNSSMVMTSFASLTKCRTMIK